MDYVLNTTNGGAEYYAEIGSKWFPKYMSTSTPREVVEVVGPCEKHGQKAIRISRGEGRNQTSYYLKTFFEVFEAYDPERHAAVDAPVVRQAPSEPLVVGDSARERLRDLVTDYERVATEATGIQATVRLEDALARVLEMGIQLEQSRMNRGGMQ